MSNSSLVSYKKISSNKTHPRNHAIDTITIHCMAGNLSVERCGDLFAKSSRQASSNYGIGSDGRIALYVDEQDRSWCSSNKANDMRAVTIEVANDGGAESGWHVSAQAMESLLKLVTDICERNNITELVWSNDKTDRVNHRNGCNMTVHRDYAARSCPGDYLYGRMGYIAEYVTAKLNPQGWVNNYQEPTVIVTSKANALLKHCKNYISTGDGVKWVQWHLARLGYYNMDIDGKCSSGSVKAIKAFQKASGLTVDGLAGPNTIRCLKLAK